jgi:hypothetical protein
MFPVDATTLENSMALLGDLDLDATLVDLHDGVGNKRRFWEVRNPGLAAESDKLRMPQSRTYKIKLQEKLNIFQQTTAHPFRLVILSTRESCNTCVLIDPVHLPNFHMSSCDTASNVEVLHWGIGNSQFEVRKRRQRPMVTNR